MKTVGGCAGGFALQGKRSGDAQGGDIYVVGDCA
jgi:hypothetical protein